MDINRQNIDFLSIYVHNRNMAGKRPIHNPAEFEAKGLFTVSEAEKQGVSHQTLYRWLKEGSVQRVRRGTFIHSSSTLPPEEQDLAVACVKFGPKSAIGGLTALYHYGLIEQVPQQIWVVVPSNRKTVEGIYHCLRITTSLKEGIEDRGHYRITNIERTLLEALKFATKIGPRIAIQATRKAIQEGQTNESKLGKMADKLKLRRVLEKYWEAIVV